MFRITCCVDIRPASCHLLVDFAQRTAASDIAPCELQASLPSLTMSPHPAFEMVGPTSARWLRTSEQKNIGVSPTYTPCRVARGMRKEREACLRGYMRPMSMSPGSGVRRQAQPRCRCLNVLLADSTASQKPDLNSAMFCLLAAHPCLHPRSPRISGIRIIPLC